ncbi:MAG: hypothetical protein M5U34_07915 [Chloroflexi bacterium]|nr:hypothetical protein [Chloroflexota bacterium]
MKTSTYCSEYAQVSRRAFLTTGMQAAAAMFVGPRLYALPEWLPRITLADPHIRAARRYADLHLFCGAGRMA